ITFADPFDRPVSTDDVLVNGPPTGHQRAIDDADPHTPSPEHGSFTRSVFDVLIAGGHIIDGSGNVGFRGAVGIADERVTILRGDVTDAQAARTIDATERIVCPGFIDFHAHSGLVILS